MGHYTSASVTQITCDPPSLFCTGCIALLMQQNTEIICGIGILVLHAETPRLTRDIQTVAFHRGVANRIVIRDGPRRMQDLLPGFIQNFRIFRFDVFGDVIRIGAVNLVDNGVVGGKPGQHFITSVKGSPTGH